MSRFICEDIKNISSYVPGEQPTDKKYIKLNTNESPYVVPKALVKAAAKEAEKLNLYSDPSASELVKTIAGFHKILPENIIVTNGSDEVLAFITQAYARGKKAMFPDVTYGFYSSLCELYGVKYTEVPLEGDYSVSFGGYKKADIVFLANPNAQTGISIKAEQVIDFVNSSKSRLVVVDEAYVDFGGETVIDYVNDCDNLIVTRTFSKSRSLAGGRLGYAAANKEIISELLKIKYSFNPYSVNRMTLAAGKTAMESSIYFDECAKKIIQTRDRVTDELLLLGGEVIPSSANFIMVRFAKISGESLKNILAVNGILVRHFKNERINDYIRVTVGSDKEMRIFVSAVKKIIGDSV